MIENNEPSLTKEQIIALLSQELTTSQKILGELRRERLDKTLIALENHDKFSARLGELSLAIAAALTPVLIIADNQIYNKGYIIVGMFIYLATGITTILHSKRRLEDDLDIVPSMGIVLERDVEKINHSISKLIFDYENPDHKNEYLQNTKSFLSNRSKTKEFSNKIDYYLDFITAGFLLATLSCIKAVWIFNQILYWTIAIMFLSAVAIIIIKSAFKAKERQCDKICTQKELDKENSDYLKWYNRNILREKE